MLDMFFSHRAHGGHGGFKRTVSSPQKASGIQSSQSVSTNVDTNKQATQSLHPLHRGISVITPLPFGGGEGGGATIFLNPVYSVLLCKSVRNRTHLRVVGRFFFYAGYFLSLTEHTEVTEVLSSRFRAHRRPPAYRVHRALQLKVGVGCWALGVEDQPQMGGG